MYENAALIGVFILSMIFLNHVFPNLFWLFYFLLPLGVTYYFGKSPRDFGLTVCRWEYVLFAIIAGLLFGVAGSLFFDYKFTIVSLLKIICIEFFFRGFVLYIFPYSNKTAFVSSSLFAISYFNASLILPLFFAGMLLSWVVYKTDSILPTTIIHTLFLLIV